MANLETSINEIVDALKDVRRSDGALKNEIVTLDSLDPVVRAGVGAGALAAAASAASSADAAGASAVAAASSATAASYSATAAATSATGASGYASTTLTYRNEASTERTAAQTARNYANQWATAPSFTDIDDGVNPVGKSAYHWAQVAEGAATGALPDGSVTRAKLDEEVADEIGSKADATATIAALAKRVGYATPSAVSLFLRYA